MPSVVPGGRIALVAASDEVWSNGPSAIRRGLLALSEHLECEAETGNAPGGVASPTRVPTVWILRTTQDQYHLAHVAHRIPAAAWSLVPSLNPVHAPGTKQAVKMLFPIVSGEPLAIFDGHFWRKQ
ncbi:MAG: hypothetical protein H7293_04920 [Candidatus Saccharibacteria bacterium]|nr:hypothetical protein [Rhodoferax sp.]